MEVQENPNLTKYTRAEVKELYPKIQLRAFELDIFGHGLTAITDILNAEFDVSPMKFCETDTEAMIRAENIFYGLTSVPREGVSDVK